MYYTEDTLVPKMTSNTAPSGAAFASSTFSTTANFPFNAFNRLDDTAGNAFATVNLTIQGHLGYIFLDKTLVGKYSLRNFDSAYNNRMPKDWTFEGSNDTTDGANGTWMILDTRVGESWDASNADKEYVISSPVSCKAYRIKWTANNGFTNLTSFNELKMFGVVYDSKFLISSGDEYFSIKEDYGLNLIPTLTSNISNGVASASGFYNSMYPAWQAFDGSNITGWTVQSSTGWLSYEFLEAKIISRYTIMKRFDASATDAPKSWTFEGYDEKALNWIVLDAQVNVTNFTNDDKLYFSLSNSQAFRKYRINIAASNNPGTWVGIGELEMFDKNFDGIQYIENCVEQDFISKGLNRKTNINLNSLRGGRSYLVKTSNPLGSGKVFKKSIDTSKIPIKKMTIT